MSGTLFVVATPIGNMEDLTLRAKRVLGDVDIVACEDTRVTGKLLAALEIKKPLLSIQEHSIGKRVEEVVVRLIKGENVAYVSDAGTPGVNDPGGKLVEETMKRGVPTIPIPGPSALTAAISVCGFPMNRFTYLGFLPLKGKDRVFREMTEREDATIFFESTHRIIKTLTGLIEKMGPSRPLYVGRELTKKFETSYRGTGPDVLAAINASSTKGEFTVIIAPRDFV